MIKKSTPQTAAAAITEDTKIEALMTQFAGVRSEIFNSMDEIAERFYRFSDVKQVRNNELIKNPFRTERYWGNFWQTTSPKVSDYSPSTETAKQSEQVQLSGPMQLLSIMSTDTGKCCMIDDRILYVGDTIRGFKVQHIGDNFVKLESQGAGTEPNNSKGYFGTELILKLSE
jgi:hypothetical protein